VRYRFLNVKYFSHPKTRLNKTFLLTVQKVNKNIIYSNAQCSFRAVTVLQKDRTVQHTHTCIHEKGKKRINQNEMCKLGVLALLSGNNGNDKLIKDKSSFGLSSFSF
jgi:hypothetical protein